MNGKAQQYLIYGFIIVVIIAAAWAVSGFFTENGHSDAAMTPS